MLKTVRVHKYFNTNIQVRLAQIQPRLNSSWSDTTKHKLLLMGASTKLKINTMEDWYNVTTEAIITKSNSNCNLRI